MMRPYQAAIRDWQGALNKEASSLTSFSSHLKRLSTEADLQSALMLGERDRSCDSRIP